MSNATTFNHIIETASQLPLEQQEMLIEILHKRGIEQRRTAIATAAQQSIALFHAGELPAQSAAAVIAMLGGSEPQLDDIPRRQSLIKHSN
ncbi:hypothetical protein [Thiospirillum jenense]|uniref:hypothetical protein n=1 Tax=Thiospirillum jenense TaxID=1653858 RepID=UPI001932B10D|nr:hypothetical protein [Thiospirillum jenense]